MSDTINLGLCKKYKPTDLKNFIGNFELKKELLSLFDSNIIPQAILLKGESGCGKTTLAHIIAEKYKKINNIATDIVDECIIDIDIITPDLESKKVGVCIIDECQFGTIQAQNNVADIIEKSKNKVLFILCTTDINEISQELLNKCQLILNVGKSTKQELVDLLRDICIKENIKYDEAGLTRIVINNDYIVRRALLTLEYIVSKGNNATYESVTEIINKK